MKKSVALRSAIQQRRAVVVPGCHDALSARVIESSGFEAIQVSGFGLAASLLGAPDVGLVQMKDVLDLTWNIAQVVGIPVMADLDTGGGNAVNAAWSTSRLIAMDVAGMNIEDQVFPKRCGHMAGKEVIPADEMAGKIRACASVRDDLDPAFVINARTDALSIHGLDEAIRRCNLYLDAGADLAFIDGIRTKAEIARAVAALRGPLSVNLMDAITGVKTELVPVPELARMGVGRVSIPVASVMVTHRALARFFSALRSSPSGLLEGATDWATSFEDFTEFVGLSRYRALEKRFLPRERLEEKYRPGVEVAGERHALPDCSRRTSWE
jgi:methylisocitrate lyase